MEFGPKHCQNMLRRYAIFSLGMVDSRCEEGHIGQSKLKMRKRATYLCDCINQHNDLARIAKDVRTMANESRSDSLETGG